MIQLKNDAKLLDLGLREIHRIQPGILLLQIIRSAANSVFPFVNIYMSSLIINAIVAQDGIEILTRYVFVTVLLNFTVTVMIRLMNRRISVLQMQFEYKCEMNLDKKIMEMDYKKVEDPAIHRLKQQIDDIRNISNGGIWKLCDSFQLLTKDLFTVAFSVSMTFPLFIPSNEKFGNGILRFAASPAFSLTMALFIMINVFIGMYTNSASTKKMYTIMSDLIPFNRIFGYYLNNYISVYHAAKDIRLYDQHDLINEESMELFSECNGTLGKLAKNQVKYKNISTVSTGIIGMLIYLFVSLKAFAGLFGVGLIVQYISSIGQFTSGLTDFMSQFASLRANNNSLQLYFNFLHTPSEMQQGTLSVQGKKSEIEFKNVFFKYPGSSQYALQNLNLKIKSGERLAVVGTNGSGKTTMIKILCRLYDPTKGQVQLDGIDIKEYPCNEYQKIFSVAFQDFQLFSFALGQNVAASIKYNKERVEASLTKAGLSEMFASMQRGLETPLYRNFETDGIEISGGEAQKIAIARALYKDAPFIILDEPTSALDPVAEYEIYSRLNEIVGDRTAVFISHRLSSCRFCNDIAVFDNGNLVQRGTHEELLQDKKGKYYELWNAQSQYYVDTPKSF